MASSSLRGWHVVVLLPFVLSTSDAARGLLRAEFVSPTLSVSENANLGEDCWQHGCRGGPCSYCGTGFCCRKGSFRGGCDGISGNETRHVCTPKPPDATDIMHLGEECWQAADCRDGLCGYCGTGLCCRKGSFRGGCDSISGEESRHVCTPPPGFTAPVNLGNECWQAGGCRDGRCGYCGSGLCCRLGRAGAECDGRHGGHNRHECVALEDALPWKMNFALGFDMADLFPSGEAEGSGVSAQQPADPRLRWNPHVHFGDLDADALADWLVKNRGLTPQEAQVKIMSQFPAKFPAEPFSAGPGLQWNPNVRTTNGKAGSLAAYLVKKHGFTQQEAQQRVMAQSPEQFQAKRPHRMQFHVDEGPLAYQVPEPEYIQPEWAHNWS